MIGIPKYAACNAALSEDILDNLSAKQDHHVQNMLIAASKTAVCMALSAYIAWL